MENITNIIKAVLANKADILNAITYIVTAASIFIKLTPTVKDDNFFKPILKFIGKYIAINK